MTTWDERKRSVNLRRHGLDFAGCEAVFDNPTLVAEDARADYGEPRMNLLGWLDDLYRARRRAARDLTANGDKA